MTSNTAPEPASRCAREMSFARICRTFVASMRSQCSESRLMTTSGAISSTYPTAMIDCGPGTLRRLAQAGADIADVDAVFLTHFHTDHCADLGPLLFALRNPAYTGRKPLHVFAAVGLERHLTLLFTAWPWATAKGYELHTKELTPGDFTFGDLQVKAVPIRHTAQSLSLICMAMEISLAAWRKGWKVNLRRTS